MCGWLDGWMNKWMDGLVEEIKSWKGAIYYSENDFPPADS